MEACIKQDLVLMEILSFFAGIVLFYAHVWEALACLLLLCWFVHSFRFILYFLLGLLWAWIHQYYTQPVGIPSHKMVITHAQLEGLVSTLPKQGDHKIQFQFEVQQFNGQPAQTIVWMNCYQACPQMSVGERWRLSAVLKKPKVSSLPGEMNPQFWLMNNHIAWLGVMNGAHAALLAKPAGVWKFQAFRSSLADSLAQVLKDEPTLGLIQGLTLGVASHIEKKQWDLFRRTGTTHLVVISGEHIGLIAGFVFIVMQYVWTLPPRLALKIPAQQAAGIAAWFIGCFYAFLSGLGAPVERALIAFGLFLLRYFLSRRFGMWQAWRYALFLILCIEPHVVVTPGFYLSFLAVAILVLVSARFPAKGLRLMVQLQLACLIGLMPLTLYAFSYASLNGFFVNLLAIPWVGFVIVPSALIGLVLIQIYPWSGWLWIAKQTSAVFMTLLFYLDRFEWMNLTLSIEQVYELLAILIGLSLMCLMPIRRLMPVYMLLIVVGFIPRREVIGDAQAKVMLLDVGQGLSVLVRTAHHTLLYDTGGAFYQGGDWASFKIIPYMKYLKIKNLDGLVISHQDLDHRGGMTSIEQAYTVGKLWVNEPAFYHRGYSCHEAQTWQWDGVTFRFFSLPIALEKRNNTCCILQITTKFGRVLLTGDIEEKAETFLVSHYGNALRSNYLVVPHHGSQTSSSLDFVKQVNPQIGFISSGLNNRYHFPHRRTLLTYKQLHIPLRNTAVLGAIEIKLMKDRSLYWRSVIQGIP